MFPIHGHKEAISMAAATKNYIKFVEELSFNAWPSYKTELYDDWLMGYSDFYTHRTNCVNIIGALTLPFEEKILYCEENYARLHTPSVFKINPLFHAPLDKTLATKGYEIEHETDTYGLNLMEYTPPKASDWVVELTDVISEEWITHLLRLNKTTKSNHLAIVPKMYEAISRDVITACIRYKDTIVATGLGIIERDHLGIYAIYVQEDQRGKGLGRSICFSLLAEGKKRGLQQAYLQVVKENKIAKRLYEGLGFHYLYSYWFRVKYLEMNEFKERT